MCCHDAPRLPVAAVAAGPRRRSAEGRPRGWLRQPGAPPNSLTCTFRPPRSSPTLLFSCRSPSPRVLPISRHCARALRQTRPSPCLAQQRCWRLTPPLVTRRAPCTAEPSQRASDC
eukprot:6182062-Pleurochrysis_carterae.AAC.2